MKKLVCGFIIGALVSVSVQSSAYSSSWNWGATELISLNRLGELLLQMHNTQEKMYAKLKSIDERLAIENSK